MLLISFHDHPNNIAAYSDRGAFQGLVLKGSPQDVRGLRGFAVVGKTESGEAVLWVASSSREHSAVLCYTGAGLSYTYQGPAYVGRGAHEANSPNSVWHPFDFTFDDSGYCYVSNQDPNVVARLKVAADLKTMTPAPLPEALRPYQQPRRTFLRGTFVACGPVESAPVHLPQVPPTPPVPFPLGLHARIDPSTGKVASSVRGVLWLGGVLYVADEAGDTVKAYDSKTGSILGESTGIRGPVHLLPHTDPSGAPGLLATGITDLGKLGLFCAALDSNRTSPRFNEVANITVEKPSGISVGPLGLYVPDRKTESDTDLDGYSNVYVYPKFSCTQAGKPNTFTVCAEPEFALWVADT